MERFRDVKNNMMRHYYLLVGLMLIPLFFQDKSFASPDDRDVFLVGNSLTYGALPFELDGDVDYHVQTNNNLHQIVNSPFINGPGSTMWTEALSENRYDVLVVQVYFGTTLEQDFAAIKIWGDMQPGADIVIFTGWPKHTIWESVYASAPINEEGQSKAYIGALLGALQAEYPSRKVTVTRHMEVLEMVRKDASVGQAPFSTFSEIFRDETHLSYEEGRYLSHNLLRQSLGQQVKGDVTDISFDKRQYLDGLIKEEINVYLPWVSG